MVCAGRPSLTPGVWTAQIGLPGITRASEMLQSADPETGGRQTSGSARSPVLSLTMNTCAAPMISVVIPAPVDDILHNYCPEML
jgi:hypothetical protein